MKTAERVMNLARNMGPRYIAFRTWFQLKKKTRLLHREFPVNPPQKKFITLQEWKDSNTPFFFNSKEEVKVVPQADNGLKEKAEKILAGEFQMFSSVSYHLGNNYDWITNPDTKHRYDITKHWLDINDFSRDAGDIKYVWEKSRFSYLFTLIRYEHHYNIDVSTFIFQEIIDWIESNPVNLGPNYKCSQEISLRILNWTFALNYYKNSASLTDQVFEKIINSIYWQVKHVYSNINFSRIAVRNNHAITETMVLYLVGLLYPCFPEAEKWKTKGKAWFEEEVSYQIYEDGTYLQFSMNYHRVVIQLLTWGIKLSELNKVKLNSTIYDRANASVDFLTSCMDKETGWLPNYGANDGALFFPLNDQDFRDYRPQLQALSSLLGISPVDNKFEDLAWYGIENTAKHVDSIQASVIHSYPIGGYYVISESDCMTFLRCGNHKDRPSQADNLHLDLWINSQNILRDAGSYKYNADEESINYFFGTGSHNTVMIGDNNQMLKGSRFIWYNWTQAIKASLIENDDCYIFEGSIKAFQQVDPGIVHSRTVKKYKNQFKWEVTDTVVDPTNSIMSQLWHPNSAEGLHVSITAFDATGKSLEARKRKSWYSPKYGIKEECDEIVFSTSEKNIRTVIEVAT